MVAFITPEVRSGESGLSPVPSRAARALRDLREGLNRSWFWSALAIQDIRLRYRGSALGPIWLTLSTAIMIAAMGTIYCRLFNVDVATYLPYVAAGLVIWQFISNLIMDGCNTFVAVQSLIQQVRIPYSAHACRVVARNVIIFAHNLVIIPIVFLLFPPDINWRLALFPLGLLVVIVNGMWICTLFGMVAARFRDVPPIVASFIQVVFFVTPIFWPVSAIGSFRAYAELNPLFAAIDIMRSPLLGLPPAPYSWTIVGAVTIIGCSATFLLFARFRSRIAFWV
jgi:homopolymeric O-antigen transport system permease protein